MSSGSKDLINNLPDELLCHILSFLTTKEAALTSVIARRWRHLLAFVKNLDFDDSIYLHHEDRVKNPLEGIYPPGFKIFVNGKRKKLSTSFPDFVNRILGLQGNATVEKVSFKIVDDYDPVDKDSVIFWIHNVLLRGVSDLHLRLDLDWDDSLPSRIFLSQTLVSLKLHTSGQPSFDVKHVHLPKLKILHLEIVMFEKDSVGFSMLMSGCPVLEELVMDNICSYLWEYFSVSVSTLKRLTFHWNVRDENPCSVSFVTPNLAYLEYTEVVADEYPKVNLDSLVEAKIDLRMTDDQVEEVRIRYEANDFIVDEQFVQGNEGNYVVGNATDFIVGIRNVQILYLSANTLEVLTFCCKTIPVFNKLTHLTMKSDPEVGWESLPRLLKNCPVLKTLVFQGLLHRATDKCGDMCLCRSRDEDVATCLSSSPVKVLKILINDEKNIERQIEQVNHFLQWMPQLELLVVYYDSSFDGDVNVSMQLQMLTGRTSPKCNIQLISRDLSKPSTMPTSKWGPLL